MKFSFAGKQFDYDMMGQGSPLLLVHGWGGSSESLRKLAVLLSEKHQCILVDLPGFGRSDTPPPEWGNKEYARVLVGLLDELKIKKTNYFGHSFGGAMGIYLSATTKRIDHLILCNSSYKRTAKTSPLARLAKRLIPGNNAPLKLILYRIFYRGSDIARFPQLEQNFRKIMKEDLTPLVGQVKVPTLIIWGEHDTVTPLSLGEELHKIIDGSKFVMIPDTRHGLPLRNPELLIDPIEEFLK